MEMTDSERGTGIALNFPANDGDDETTTSSPSSSSHSPPKLPRRLRRRLMQQQSKTPITAEEIESKLTQARLRRQVAPLSLSHTGFAYRPEIFRNSIWILWFSIYGFQIVITIIAEESLIGFCRNSTTFCQAKRGGSRKFRLHLLHNRKIWLGGSSPTSMLLNRKGKHFAEKSWIAFCVLLDCLINLLFFLFLFLSFFLECFFFYINWKIFVDFNILSVWMHTH